MQSSTFFLQFRHMRILKEKSCNDNTFLHGYYRIWQGDRLEMYKPMILKEEKNHEPFLYKQGGKVAA